MASPNQNMISKIELALKARANAALAKRREAQKQAAAERLEYALNHPYTPFKDEGARLIDAISQAEFEEIVSLNKAEDLTLRGLDSSKVKEELNFFFFITGEEEDERMYWRLAEKSVFAFKPTMKAKPASTMEALYWRRYYASEEPQVEEAPNFCAMTAREAHFARLELAILRTEQQLILGFDPLFMDEEDWAELEETKSRLDQLRQRRERPWHEARPLTYAPFAQLQL